MLKTDQFDDPNTCEAYERSDRSDGELRDLWRQVVKQAWEDCSNHKGKIQECDRVASYAWLTSEDPWFANDREAVCLAADVDEAGLRRRALAELASQPSPTELGPIECALFAELQSRGDGRITISDLAKRTEWWRKDFLQAVSVLREWGLPVFVQSGSVLYRGDVEICPSPTKQSPRSAANSLKTRKH